MAVAIRELEARAHALADVKEFIGDRYQANGEAGRSELADIMRGYVAAYLLGLVAVIGAREAWETIREVMPVPENTSGLRLVVDNTPAA